MNQASEPERGPQAVDLHVGMRIRQRRRALGLSQERLADTLGLTFQQVQKYERGANRVSASKLYEIARTLQTPMTFFFDGLADPAVARTGQVAEPEGAAFLYQMVMTPEGLELAALFPRIARSRRRLVLELARALADAAVPTDEELDLDLEAEDD